jgi:hypothetical protein
MTGLAAAIGVQAMTLGARSSSGLVLAALCAGLATGIRSQVFWLTAPLLTWKFARDDRRVDERPPMWMAASAFAVGVLLWLIPLIAVSGGAAAYWTALSSQGGEDFGGIQMLWTTPTLRTLRDALFYAFVAPWAVWPAATVVLAACATGLVVCWRNDRRSGEILAVAFVPYLLFDVLFQETFTIRYALPLVVPIAFLAARGLQALPAQPAFVALGAIAMWNAHVGGRSVAALGSEKAPIFRMLADMNTTRGSAVPVLAPDRRESFDLRRPFVWLAADAPRLERRLAAPPQHEWLEAVKYWNEGGRSPVWFVVDPRRAAIDLVQHGGATSYRWALPYPVLMSGTRPNDADWYRVDRPDWYVGEGWALTPESAGVAGRDRRGLQYGPIEAWVHRSALSGGGLSIGGRNFEATERPSLTIAVDRFWSKTFTLRPGAFMDLVRLPLSQLDPSVPDYVKVVVSSQPSARVAIEQFDFAPATGGVVGFGDGWHERELESTSGRQWRWLSERGELSYVGAGRGWSLHIEGESPLRYYKKPSRVVIKAGDRVLREVTVAGDFSIDADVPPATLPSTISIETDQTHVPAESGWKRSEDRRRLGLRIFACELRKR